MNNDNWKKEIIKKVPWSATFLVASFCFLKWTNYETLGYIFAIVAIIALFLLIKFEYYEKIINRQEKQIQYFSKIARDTQTDATKTISDMHNTATSALKRAYNSSEDIQTSVK